MRAALAAAERGSRHTRPLLVLGEAGTGRTTLARAVHAASERRHGPVVTFDSAASPSTLQESELFGWRQFGCFSTQNLVVQAGQIQDAEGGTFVLACDELAAALWRPLRRCLIEGERRLLGGTDPIPVDVRFVFEATEPSRLQPVLDLVDPDVIRLPGLAERREDLPLILAELEREGLYANADLLTRCEQDDPWPGNLRELRTEAEKATILGRLTGDGASARSE